jgi:hypothetical protein
MLSASPTELRLALPMLNAASGEPSSFATRRKVTVVNKDNHQTSIKAARRAIRCSGAMPGTGEVDSVVALTPSLLLTARGELPIFH